MITVKQKALGWTQEKLDEMKACFRDRQLEFSSELNPHVWHWIYASVPAFDSAPQYYRRAPIRHI